MDRIRKLEEEVRAIKKQFEWDEKFDLLLEREEDLKGYFESLFSMLSTSIHAYRSVKTGIVAGGDEIIQTDAAGYMDKLSKILGAVPETPVLSSFTSIVAQIASAYVKQEQG